MGKTGINNNSLKRQNRGLVLKLIATGECSSRIELAKRTSLSKMSVTNIISEFIEENMIEEQNAEAGRGQGRKPIALVLSKKAPKIIGLFIHREECTAVLCDMRLQILDKTTEKVNKENQKQFSQIIFRVIDRIIEENKEEKIAGIGVGAVGPVDIKRGMILNPPNFFGIRDFEVTALLYERYKLPVYLDSLNNCAALAEKYYGAGKRLHDFIFVGITNGVGSGIISDDKIFRNSNGLTSELGHMSIDWKGNKCSCGNRGCLETYVGARIMETELSKAVKEQLSFKQFCLMAGEKDMPEIENIFRDMIEKLACALTSIVNILNPQAVFIGHEGYYIPDIYLSYLEELINRQKLSGSYRSIKVSKPYFGEEAHLRGCACPMLEKMW